MFDLQRLDFPQAAARLPGRAPNASEGRLRGQAGPASGALRQEGRVHLRQAQHAQDHGGNQSCRVSAAALTQHGEPTCQRGGIPAPRATGGGHSGDHCRGGGARGGGGPLQCLHCVMWVMKDHVYVNMYQWRSVSTLD